MKKTLLAAALLAGFAGAASAQSSVTLYGVVDGGLRYNKVSLQNNDGVKLGWALRATHGAMSASVVKLTSQQNMLVSQLIRSAQASVS